MKTFTRIVLVFSAIAVAFTAVAGHGWKRVNYPNSTIFTGIVTVNGIPAESGDVVGIFVKGECRMVSTVFVQNDTAYISAVLHGEKTDTATIQYWSRLDDKIYNVDTNIITKPAGEIQLYPIKIKAATTPTSAKNILASELKLYPSPVKSDLNIAYNKDIKSIKIINNIGKEILIFDGRNQVDVSSLPPGIYFVSITATDGKVVTKRIVKE